MPIECDQLQKLVQSFSLVHDCDRIRSGMLRLATAFSYPEGSQIDVFLSEKSDLLGGQYVLTDLGQTMAWLLDLHVKPWTTKKRQQILADICDSLGVQNENGELRIELGADELKNLPSAIVRLSQACIRVADIAFTQRLRSLTPFRDELEEFFEGSELPYEDGVILEGQFGNPVQVEYQVRGRKVTSLIQTLSTANQAAAHGLANEVFRKWYDLVPRFAQKNQFLTIFDATNDVVRREDLARLSTLSVVFGFPAQQDQIRDAIAA